MSTLPETSPSGVIHDIGFRAYDGPRFGRRAVARALFVHSIRGVFGIGRSPRSKIVPVGLAVVMVLPALIMAIVTNVAAGQGAPAALPVEYATYTMIMQSAVAIFVATQAPQTVSLDLRFHTLPLYLSRPLERVDYVVAKYAALSAAVSLLLGVPLLTLYAGALLAGLPAGEQTVDVVLALVGAGFFAVVLAGIGLVIASRTARRGIGIAAVITVLVLSYSVVSGMQGAIGHGLGDLETAGWLGLFSPMTLVDGAQVWALGASASSPAGPPSDIAGVTFCLVTLAVIAGCFHLLMRRYRKVSM